MTIASNARLTIRFGLLASIGLTPLAVASMAPQGPSQSNTATAAPQSAPRQEESAASPSLGELARQQRAAQSQVSGKTVRAYTNDNVPGSGDLTIQVSREDQNAAKANSKPGALQGKPEEYGARAQKLSNRLETHQRELEVLQQELGENEVQYYSNPSQAVQQQYSREDINGVRTAIDRKQQQVDEDRQAISDLEDEVRREGGDPQSLEAASPHAITPPAQLDLSGTEKGSEEYWRRRFGAAREALAWAQEQRQLAEDELHLLQSQQAHDWGTPAAESAEPKIAGKQQEVESRREAEAQAQQELDALEKEFLQSGSPEAWSKPDAPEPDVTGLPQNPNP